MYWLKQFTVTKEHLCINRIILSAHGVSPFHQVVFIKTINTVVRFRRGQIAILVYSPTTFNNLNRNNIDSYIYGIDIINGKLSCMVTIADGVRNIKYFR